MHMIKRSIGFLVLVMLTLPVQAGETPWNEVAPEARVRLITSGVVEDGVTWAALEVDMPQAMKTYWRIPGETGIPTQFDTADSSGVNGHEIVWPYPTRETVDGYVDFVYHGKTVLPVRLDVAGAGAHLKADVLMGVCDEICVPVRTSFDVPLGGDADTSSDLRIRQAVARAPVPWDGAEEAIGPVAYAAESGTLTVHSDPAAVDPASIIVDNGDPTVLFSSPEPGSAPGSVRFELLDGEAGAALAGQSVRLTFMTVDGAFETTRTVEKAGGASGNG